MLVLLAAAVDGVDADKAGAVAVDVAADVG